MWDSVNENTSHLITLENFKQIWVVQDAGRNKAQQVSKHTLHWNNKYLIKSMLSHLSCWLRFSTLMWLRSVETSSLTTTSFYNCISQIWWPFYFASLATLLLGSISFISQNIRPASADYHHRKLTYDSKQIQKWKKNSSDPKIDFKSFTSHRIRLRSFYRFISAGRWRPL